MTTAVKPLADHGTTARAKGRPAAGIKGCTCRPCRDAENRYDKQRRVFNATGRTYMVDAKPAATHLRLLFEQGAGWKQLAQASGTASSTISDIVTGQRTEITRRVSDRILALTTHQTLAPNRSVPAIGSIRRVCALVAAGHRVKDITAACDLDHATVRKVLNGNPNTITAYTAEQIKNAYAHLASTPGNCTRSLNRGTREGWKTPDYWDDMGAIDDPQFAEPKYTRAQIIAEDAAWLLAAGLDRDTAAARLGVSRFYLDRSLREAKTEAAA